MPIFLEFRPQASLVIIYSFALLFTAKEAYDDYDEIGDVDDEEEEEEEEEIYEEEDVDDEEEYGIQMEGDDEYHDEEEGYTEEEEEDESSASTDIWSSYDAINEDAPVPLLDDPESDPNYQLAKQSVLAQIEARRQVDSSQADSSDVQPAGGRTFQDIFNGMTDDEREELERDVDLDEVEADYKTSGPYVALTVSF